MHPNGYPTTMVTGTDGYPATMVTRIDGYPATMVTRTDGYPATVVIRTDGYPTTMVASLILWGHSLTSVMEMTTKISQVLQPPWFEQYEYTERVEKNYSIIYLKIDQKSSYRVCSIKKVHDFPFLYLV